MLTLFASALRPTLLVLSLFTMKVVCRDVKIMLKFKESHSKLCGAVLFNNLKRQSECLNIKYFSGVALLYISCNLTNDISLVQYFKHVLMDLADDESSFCFRLFVNVGKC